MASRPMMRSRCCSAWLLRLRTGGRTSRASSPPLPPDLAIARLSIVGLGDGQQPMTHSSGDLTIAFNGEIFNYVELRETLKAQGSCVPHRQRYRSYPAPL